MAEWTGTRPQHEGVYWYLEPSAAEPTFVAVLGEYLNFLEKEWDYEPPNQGNGELFWTTPVAQPSAPDIQAGAGGGWITDWPEVDGFYWTVRKAMGVKLAKFTSEWRAYLGTEDFADRDEPIENELFWSERVTPPQMPVAMTF